MANLNIPTEPGYYWFRDVSGYPSIVEIASLIWDNDDNDFVVRIGGTEIRLREIEKTAAKYQVEFSDRLENPWPEDKEEWKGWQNHELPE